MTAAKISDIPLNPETWVEEHGDYLLGFAMLRLRDRALAQDALLTAHQGKTP